MAMEILRCVGQGVGCAPQNEEPQNVYASDWRGQLCGHIQMWPVQWLSYLLRRCLCGSAGLEGHCS